VIRAKGNLECNTENGAHNIGIMFDDETLEVRVHVDEGCEMHECASTKFETDDAAIRHGEDGTEGSEGDVML